MKNFTSRCVAFAAFSAAALSAAAGADQPIRVLLITGANNHNWRYTSRYHADTLTATGLFDVTITDEPWTDLADAKNLKGIQVFVIDYNDMGNDKKWGDAGQKNFAAAVDAGAGVVAIHSADNAFKGWAEYEKMLGLMWRDGAGHGKFHAFDVAITDHDHPITKGLSDFKAHPDELYHKLTNTQNVKYHLLAQAMSDKDTGGTGNLEPMAVTLEYGKGRVFATPLGHVWDGSQDSKSSIADPNFKALIARATEWAATGKVTQTATWTDHATHNTLTAKERAEGWKLLFDGTNTPAFKQWKHDGWPGEGWEIKDGTIHRPAGKGVGDICTLEEFGDFEFVCDWKIAQGGNSGIMYRCTEDHTYPWETGPEYQLLDNQRHQDGKKPQTSAAAMYDIKPADKDVIRPAGEWNHARIVLKGNHIEHWANGFKVMEIELGSEEFKKLHAASKWPAMKDYATKSKGRIALQDHGDEVWFRDIKVKALP